MKTSLPRPTERLRIGELRVSPFCVGMTGDPDTVKAAFDVGINFFFISADMHWPYYDGVREGLKRLLAGGVSRGDLVIAGCSYTTQPEFCTAPFAEIIESAPWLEHLDVAVMGGSYAQDFFARLPVYCRHRESRWSGISSVGATFHERKAAVPAFNHKLLDVGFIRYNPSHSGADDDVFPSLDAGHVPLFGFKSTYGSPASAKNFDELGVGEDNWRPEVADYYRYALTAPLDGILCSLSRPPHVEALLRALERGPLSEDEREYLRNIGDLVEGRAVVDAE